MNHPSHQHPMGAAPVGEQSRTPCLEQRLTAHPQLRQCFEAILETVERDIANGSTADQAEAHGQQQVRLLGREMLQHWAQEAADYVALQLPQQYPQATKHSKTHQWYSTYGPIRVNEQQW